MSSLIPLVVLLPLLGAAAALTLARYPRAQVTIASAVLGVVLVIGGLLLWYVDAYGAIAVAVGGWPAPWGITLVVDRLAALLLVISAAVLLSVLIFSVGQGLADGDDETPVSIYYPTYLILATGVFNAFIAGDLFNLYVSFEILLVASYVLITLGGTEQRIRSGVTYIVVSLVSSIIFLAAIAFIYASAGTVNIAQLAVRLAELPEDVQLILHVMLIVAFGIKAAIFPLSFWLPDSYPTAPAPVTAVFAGLLTKVGVYAIMRTEMIIFPGDDLQVPLMIAAGLTMIIGIIGAVAQSDIKRLLSFTLVSHIGYMVFGIALNTAEGLGASTYYVVHHITVQTTLFLAVGLVERVAGTTSINRIGGLLKASPVIAVLFFIPMLSLGGIPPFSGFLGKLALFDAGAKDGSVLAWLLIGAGALVSLLTLYALARAWNMAFWRDAEEVVDYEHPLPVSDADRRNDSGQVATARVVPRIMVAATGGMVAISVALTLFAGPLFDVSERAGKNIDGPGYYVTTVFEGVSE
ncbi:MULTISPECIES: Na+/H+ antiporter subunit D [unclassified Cryobacterium]|uniref:Na+/H+ antiporter subunit D n=1 Tax=unclassified Cryobacterium TaxID=2649013 RepID=UPI00144739CC